MKAKLVIEMPKKCKECVLLSQSEETGIWYCVPGLKIVRDLFNKPDWCPLEEVGE